MCIATKFQGDANAADLGPHFDSHCSNMLSTSLTCRIYSFFSVNVIRWLDLFLDSLPKIPRKKLPVMWNTDTVAARFEAKVSGWGEIFSSPPHIIYASALPAEVIYTFY